ncbi:S8 family serine peptidase [Micromonospora saelicesensis]|uniref:Subtilase family protein n=1 Tax=Micromonospora saelicesensis TaxID=285676 RepID=A0A1C4Z988_9ACTN|nr:S8 family serine peptidase [Micromonospora saelicesensis]SCF29457.1 Subtilase family protein [Micromonospora saelicesensis]
MIDDEIAAFNRRGVLTVVPRAASGRTLADDPAELLRHSVEEFLPAPATVDRVAEALTREGLAIEARTDVGLTVSGEQRLLRDVFGSVVAVVRNKYIRDSPRYELVAQGPLRSRVCTDLIGAVSAPRSGFELTATVSPPVVRGTGHHLSLPGDAVRVAGAGELHAAGIRGQGVRVVMVDTGLYDHPHHRQHGYRTSVVAALPQLDPAVDERGHGTAMSALLLAVAPEVSLTMVKMATEGFSFPVAAFQRAVQLEPDVISCSWGTLRSEPHLHLEVANAIRRGCTVLFAAGNGSTDRPTAMFQSVATPGAITVGGVHIGPDGALRAADLASSYRSAVFPGRAVPDVSGPCGMLPNGNYIVFPTQPGCLFDRRNSKYDGTGADDGWLVSSGTSGATAYAAGVVALAIQQGRASTVESLAADCVPVTQGRSITGDECGGASPNPATGHGLLTAHRLDGAVAADRPLLRSSMDRRGISA